MEIKQLEQELVYHLHTINDFLDNLIKRAQKYENLMELITQDQVNEALNILIQKDQKYENLKELFKEDKAKAELVELLQKGNAYDKLQSDEIVRKLEQAAIPIPDSLWKKEKISKLVGLNSHPYLFTKEDLGLLRKLIGKLEDSLQPKEG